MIRALVFTLLAVGCTPPQSDDTPPDGPDPYDVPVGPYEVDIRWTSWGIPHIEGADFGSVGHGMGYAFARDHVCTLADQVVMARSERARWFGPGPDDLYINQDFGWLGIGVFRQAEEGFLSLDADIQAAIIGYASGYNRYLDEVGPQGLPEPCRGAGWVQPITHVDLLAYYLVLGEASSGAIWVDAVGTAQPPSPARAAPTAHRARARKQRLGAGRRPQRQRPGHAPVQHPLPGPRREAVARVPPHHPG